MSVSIFQRRHRRRATLAYLAHNRRTLKGMSGSGGGEEAALYIQAGVDQMRNARSHARPTHFPTAGGTRRCPSGAS